MTLSVTGLFAGIGGFELGLQRAGDFRAESLVEIDARARQVLAQRFSSASLHSDVRTFSPSPVDVVCGGVPLSGHQHRTHRQRR